MRCIWWIFFVEKRIFREQLSSEGGVSRRNYWIMCGSSVFLMINSRLIFLDSWIEVEIIWTGLFQSRKDCKHDHSNNITVLGSSSKMMYFDTVREKNEPIKIKDCILPSISTIWWETDHFLLNKCIHSNQNADGSLCCMIRNHQQRFHPERNQLNINSQRLDLETLITKGFVFQEGMYTSLDITLPLFWWDARTS